MDLLRSTAQFCVFTIALAGTLAQAEDQTQEIINPQQLFEDAMARLESGKIYSAIELFETLLNNNPTLNRARLELGVAYHKASRHQEAQRQFKIVLDDPATPEKVRLAILAYMGQISSDENKPGKQHEISYFFKTGLLHNSNINTSPGFGLTRLPGGAALSTTTEKVASSGLGLDFGMTHRYKLNRPMNVADEATLFEWQSQLAANNTLYEKTSDYNLNIVSLSTGPAFISPGHWRALANLALDQYYFGTRSLATFTSINPAITFDLGQYTGVTLETSLISQNYTATQDSGRESTETVFGIGFSKLLNGTDIGMEITARRRNNNADSEEFSYQANEVYLGGFFTASANSSIYLNLSHNVFDYGAIDPGFGARRDETENSAALGYHYDHNSGFLKGWTLNLELNVINTDAKIDPFDYRRTLFSINWSKNIL